MNNYKDLPIEAQINHIYREGYLAGMAAEHEKYAWIDIDNKLPEDDRYVFLLCENFPYPVAGRYEQDEDGVGAFYFGDEMEPCINKYNIFVTAWMEIPKNC